MTGPAAVGHSLRRFDALPCAVLVLAVLLLYWPARHFSFIQFDDPILVTENPIVLQGLSRTSIYWATHSLVIGNYAPIAVMSTLLDITLFGVRPGYLHMSNVLYHCISTAEWYLLWVLLSGRRARSFTIAAIFGLHPMHVEPVAWVCGRGDVLCMALSVAALLFYVQFIRSAWRPWYVLALILYGLGIMSKTIAMVLPGVMILINVWPLQRISRTQNLKGDCRAFAREMSPFLAMACAAAALGIIGRWSSHFTLSWQMWTVIDRLANIVFGYNLYLLKFIWPEPMVVLYPLRHVYSGGAVIASIILLVFISIMVARTRKRRPYLLFGWVWFLGTLLPNIGIVQTGAQSIADRYTYWPYVGLSAAAVWWAADTFAGRSDKVVTSRKMVTAALCCVFLLASMFDSRKQLNYWSSNFALYSHAWLYEPNDDIISNAMGSEYTQQNRPDLALEAFSRAVALNPYNSNAQTNLGNLLLRIDAQQALPHFQWAVRAAPDDPVHWWDLGVCQQQLKRYVEAAKSYQQALQVDPAYEPALRSLKSIPPAP